MFLLLVFYPFLLFSMGHSYQPLVQRDNLQETDGSSKFKPKVTVLEDGSRMEVNFTSLSSVMMPVVKKTFLSEDLTLEKFEFHLNLDPEMSLIADSQVDPEDYLFDTLEKLDKLELNAGLKHRIQKFIKTYPEYAGYNYKRNTILTYEAIFAYIELKFNNKVDTGNIYKLFWFINTLMTNSNSREFLQLKYINSMSTIDIIKKFEYIIPELKDLLRL